MIYAEKSGPVGKNIPLNGAERKKKACAGTQAINNVKQQIKYMQIILRRLVIKDFKGIRHLDITFDHITNVYGANASGKTTIFDATVWLLFDKDSTDRKDFEIKTLDSNNQAYHELDHEVTGYFDVDGQELVLRKVYREKWTKPRGSKEKVFDGHQKDYFWNNVPMKEKEYQAAINGLVTETTFKMLTNPLYFNNTLKWQERRSMLLQLAGNIDQRDIVATNPALFQSLIKEINGKKTMEQYQREVRAKIKQIKDQMDIIPSRIDEAKRSLPEQMDYDALLAEVESNEVELQKVEDLLLNQTNAEKKRNEELKKLLGRKQELEKILMDVEFETKQTFRSSRELRIQDLNDAKNQIATVNSEKNRSIVSKGHDETAKAKLQEEQNQLRHQWNKINADVLTFDDNQFCCPTCKRAYEADDIDAKKEELTKNFNSNKSRLLKENNDRGKAIGEEIKILEASISNKQKAIETAEAEYQLLADKIKTLNEEHQRLTDNEDQQLQVLIDGDHRTIAAKKEIAEIDQKLTAPSAATNKAGLLQQKADLQKVINDLQAKLNTKAVKERAEARIAELENQEGEMSQELTTLEGIDYSIDQYSKAEMDVLDSRVNKMFTLVKFKMFEEQINGGSQPTCVALIDGVPFSDANTASKLNAGLDIINTLSGHFGVTAPIFIDNRESVVDVIEVDSQIINLVVSAADKKLRIEQHSEQRALA